jgi:hypothetical protein
MSLSATLDIYVDTFDKTFMIADLMDTEPKQKRKAIRIDFNDTVNGQIISKWIYRSKLKNIVAIGCRIRDLNATQIHL